MGKTRKALMYSKLACQMAVLLELNVEPDKLEYLEHETWLVRELRRRAWHAIICVDKCNTFV